MANLFLTGSGVPTNAVGEVSDYYRDTASNLIYYRAALGWEAVPSLIPTPDGVGTNWLFGTGAPNNGIGATNDYYRDDANGIIYRKHAVNGWEAKGSLDFIGVYGVQWGEGTGAPANTEPLNNLPAGSFYLDVATSDIYYKDNTLTWSLKGQLGSVTVVDALDSTSATAALSANQGKVLDGRLQTVESNKANTNSAYVDFTKQANGTPLSVLDTGQTVDYTINAGGRMPVISNGRLIVNNQAGAGTGGLADYYQCDLGSPIVRVGAEWIQPSGADDGNGNTTIIAWDGIYEGGGTLVPRSWVHMSIVPGTGATGTAKWFTCDGAGNLLNVKSQTFTNPPADGVAIWRFEAVLDKEAGIAFAWLPDGSIMRLTDEEIATFCTAVSKPIQSLKNLDSKVLVVEHYCGTGANAARFAEFINCFAETESPSFKLRSSSPLNAAYRAFSLKSLVPQVSVGVSYAPSSVQSLATTTSAANIDGTNGKFSCTAGPNGIVLVVASAYYEWSATDALYWRLAGTVNTSTRVADVGVNGQKRVVTQTILVTGLTPGETITETLQHWTTANSSATCKTGGTGGAMLPPITLLAIPA